MKQTKNKSAAAKQTGSNDDVKKMNSSSLATAVALAAAAAAAAAASNNKSNNGGNEQVVTSSGGEMVILGDDMELGADGEPKKRVSANKKERRRTQSINNAFTDLRNRIPQIPTDTKLSKIKTLKLAINYIEHLMKILREENDPTSFEPFKPDLGKLRRESRSREIKVVR